MPRQLPASLSDAPFGANCRCVLYLGYISTYVIEKISNSASRYLPAVARITISLFVGDYNS